MTARGIAFLLLVATACHEPKPLPPAGEPAMTAPPSAPPPSRVTVLVVGDSLAAGMGLPEREAYPAVLESLLREHGLAVSVQNAGVSGDTTKGGLERIDWLLRSKPGVVVLELGANDGLRGLPLEQTESNLRGMVQRSQAVGARVLVVGMRVPTNMGADYAEGFAAIFPRVAHDTGADLVPFLLEGVALRPELNQADGIHPTAEGHRLLAATVLPHLEPLVRQVTESSSPGSATGPSR